MSLLGKAIDVMTGGTSSAISEVAKGAIELAEKYFPPDLSPQEKLEWRVKMQALENENLKNARTSLDKGAALLNERLAAHEGTAKDLLALPVVGRVLIFARGAQRPVWGFATLWIDYMLYSSQWSIAMMTEARVLGDGSIAQASWTPMGALIVVINFLVLGFLFGERAVKNLEPIILKFFGPKG